MVTLGQAHGAEEQAHRDLAGEIVDKLELLPFAYALKRAIGDIEGRRDELLDILARERGLAQCPQPIVPGRIRPLMLLEGTGDFRPLSGPPPVVPPAGALGA